MMMIVMLSEYCFSYVAMQKVRKWTFCTQVQLNDSGEIRALKARSR